MFINFFNIFKKYEGRLLNRLRQKRFPHFCSIKFSDKSKHFRAKKEDPSLLCNLLRIGIPINHLTNIS